MCGGQGRLLGGVYSFAGETVKLLKGPERTVSELQRLAQILGPVGQGAVAAQEAQMMARDELPAALAQIADEIANTREADERRFKIRVVIAAISLLVAAVFANNINIQDVDISIDSIFKLVVQQQAEQPEDFR